MKTGVVDVGGGMRGIYAAGIFDYCMEKKITFDLGIGVSAGSANLASFIAGQEGRNYTFYTDYSLRKEYMGWKNFLKKGYFVNFDYIYGALSNSDGENPLDYPGLMASPCEFVIVATEAETGKPVYFTKNDLKQDEYSIFSASSCVPVVNHPYPVNGKTYFDGALGDSVPIEKAFELGCDKVLLVLTKPAGIPREQGKDLKLGKIMKRKYPESAAKLIKRAENYNNAVAKAKALEKEGRVLILSPDDTCGVDTLKRDKASLEKLYAKGKKDAEKISDWMR